jgi:hypothetical protein
MNNSESQAQRAGLDHPQVAPDGPLGRRMRSITESARRAETVVEEHPYFTAGVLAGITLAIGSVMIFAPRRRQSFVDIVRGWF